MTSLTIMFFTGAGVQQAIFCELVDTSNLVFWRLAARVASVVVTLLQLQTSQTQLPPKLQLSHFTLFLDGQYSFYQPYFVFVAHPYTTLKYSLRTVSLTKYSSSCLLLNRTKRSTAKSFFALHQHQCAVAMVMAASGPQSVTKPDCESTNGEREERVNKKV